MGFFWYINNRSPVPTIPSKSHGLAEENQKLLTEWKCFKTSILFKIEHI
jgi:hypothetical protein